MAAKTTGEMIAVLDQVTSYSRLIEDLLGADFSEQRLLRFREALVSAGMTPDRAGDMVATLEHFVTRMRESAASIGRQVDPAQHCVSAAAHRATGGRARDLVL